MYCRHSKGGNKGRGVVGGGFTQRLLGRVCTKCGPPASMPRMIALTCSAISPIMNGSSPRTSWLRPQRKSRKTLTLGAKQFKPLASVLAPLLRGRAML